MLLFVLEMAMRHCCSASRTPPLPESLSVLYLLLRFSWAAAFFYRRRFSEQWLRVLQFNEMIGSIVTRITRPSATVVRRRRGRHRSLLLHLGGGDAPFEAVVLFLRALPLARDGHSSRFIRSASVAEETFHTAVRVAESLSEQHNKHDGRFLCSQRIAVLGIDGEAHLCGAVVASFSVMVAALDAAADHGAFAEVRGFTEEMRRDARVLEHCTVLDAMAAFHALLDAARPLRCSPMLPLNYREFGELCETYYCDGSARLPAERGPTPSRGTLCVVEAQGILSSIAKGMDASSDWHGCWTPPMQRMARNLSRCARRVLGGVTHRLKTLTALCDTGAVATLMGLTLLSGTVLRHSLSCPIDASDGTGAAAESQPDCSIAPLCRQPSTEYAAAMQCVTRIVAESFAALQGYLVAAMSRRASRHLVANAFFEAATSDDLPLAWAQLQTTKLHDAPETAKQVLQLLLSLLGRVQYALDLADVVLFGVKAPAALCGMLLTRLLLLPRVKDALPTTANLELMRQMLAVEQAEWLDVDAERAAIAAGREVYPRCGRAGLFGQACDLNRTHPELFQRWTKLRGREFVVRPHYGLATLFGAIHRSPADSPNTPARSVIALTMIHGDTRWPTTPLVTWASPTAMAARMHWTAASETFAADTTATFLMNQGIIEAFAERDLARRVSEARSVARPVARTGLVAERTALRQIARTIARGSLRHGTVAMLGKGRHFDEFRLHGTEGAILEAILAVAEAGAHNVPDPIVATAITDQVVSDVFARQAQRRLQLVARNVVRNSIGSRADDEDLSLQAQRVDRWAEALSNHIPPRTKLTVPVLARLVLSGSIKQGSDAPPFVEEIELLRGLPHTIDRPYFRGAPLPWEWLDESLRREGSGSLSVTFEGVSVAYPASGATSQLALNNVSFHVPGGAHCALLGASGSGKSTVFALLLRSIDPCAGRISLGGIDLRDLPPRWLRRRIAAVTQRTAVIGELTTQEWLRLTAPGCTQRDVTESLWRSCAADFLEEVSDSQLPLSHICRECSGGEAQRLLIAQAVLRSLSGRHGAVLTLLDEATSALDSDTEQRLGERNAFRGGGRRTTCITATHRLYHVRDADIVIVLEEGHLVHCGSWAELVVASPAVAAELQGKPSTAPSERREGVRQEGDCRVARRAAEVLLHRVAKLSIKGGAGAVIARRILNTITVQCHDS